MRRLTEISGALVGGLLAVPCLLALTALALLLTIAFSPITVPIVLMALRALDDPSRADDDDCAAFVVWLLVSSLVVLPVVPLIGAHGAWRATFRGVRRALSGRGEN